MGLEICRAVALLIHQPWNETDDKLAHSVTNC